jgi:hypothetical protein
MLLSSCSIQEHFVFKEYADLKCKTIVGSYKRLDKVDPKRYIPCWPRPFYLYNDGLWYVYRGHGAGVLYDTVGTYKWDEEISFSKTECCK